MKYIKIADPRFEYAIKEQMGTAVEITGQVDLETASSLKELNASSRGITSLEGIEYFISLEKLSIADNPIIQVDISTLTHIKELDCSSAYGAIDVRIQSDLSSLRCNADQLTSLVQDPLSLKELTLITTKPIGQLPELVFKMHDLEVLYASFLGLETISGIKQLKKLHTLDISNNRITELNEEIFELEVMKLKTDKNPLEKLPADMIDYYKVLIEMVYAYGEMSDDGVCDEEWKESFFYLCKRSHSDESLHARFDDHGKEELQIVHEWEEQDLIIKISNNYNPDIFPTQKKPVRDLGIDGLPF